MKSSMMFCFGGLDFGTKGSTKLDITMITCIVHITRSILKLFLFDIAPNLLILHTPQWNNPNVYGIKQKANEHAFQGYLTWWIQIQDNWNEVDQNRVALLFLRVYIHKHICRPTTYKFDLTLRWQLGWDPVQLVVPEDSWQVLVVEPDRR